MAPSPIVTEDITTIARGVADHANHLAGRTVLISGGAGFLGSYFLGVFKYLNKHVLAKPVRVISVDNFITSISDGQATEADPHILNVWGDVTYPLPVREKVDYIIHAAGLASPVYYMQYPLETIESAVTGAKNLLELARKNSLEGFLFFSSSEIYGDPAAEAVPTPETYHGNVSSVGPRACYDESKRLAETICSIYHGRFGVPISVVRPFNVFGPGMRHDDRRVIPMFVYQALNGRTLPVHGDGRQTRTFCYVTDAMIGFMQTLLIGQRGEAYNIGNSENEISMRNLAGMFTELVGDYVRNETVPYPETYPAGEPQRRCPDLTKSRAHLGYEATVGLRPGLERFLTWARESGAYLDVVESETATQSVRA